MIRAWLLTASLLVAACHSSPGECPVRCGDRCLPASACTGITCPDDQPCDPCSGQCRSRCDETTPCRDPSQRCCAGACVDPQSDVSDCGACGNSCLGRGDRCTEGACACGDGPACSPGTLCCGGVCVTLDTRNCGACGASCADGETCDISGGGCRCGSKIAAGAVCGNGQACCSGLCRDVTTDPTNCGGCDAACASNVACKNGRCDCTMAGCVDPAQSCCEGGCVSEATDEEDCGACGVRCGAAELCVAAQCTCNTAKVSGGPACTGATTCCPGGCFDVQTSGSNCGLCGRTCDAATTTGCAAGKCTCKSGYMPTTDPTRCADINECATANGGCSDNALCTNTAGGRTCTCKSGFSGNGVTCTDVNECAPGGGQMCSPYADCTNNTGGYSCACKGGFSGNGFSCSDVDECMNPVPPCSVKPHSQCLNSFGSYSCNCVPGYTESNGACCLNCTGVAPRMGVPQCDAVPWNDATTVAHDNACGSTVSCGDCCHAAKFCAGNGCYQYKCGCSDSGTMPSCASAGGIWQGSAGLNCCHFVLGTSCMIDSDC